MRTIPLILKVKTSAQSPQFHIASDTTINFMDTTHGFASIVSDELPKHLLDSWTRTSSTVALVGPPSSGKSVSFLEILRSFVQSNANVQITACEVNRNKSFVDLLDANASRRYMTSISFETQLKRATLDGRVLAKLMREPSSVSKTASSKYSRMCLLVNIYHDCKCLTVIYLTSTGNLGLPAVSQHGISRNLNATFNLRGVSPVNLNFLAHLDQQADQVIIADALRHYAHAVKAFSSSQNDLNTPPLTTQARAVPGYARSTLSSRGSPGAVSIKTAASSKRRLPSPITPEIRKRASPISRRDPRRLNVSNSVANKESEEVKTLEVAMDTLQSQLQEEKSSKRKVIKTLQEQFRAIKSHTLVNLQNEVSNTKMFLDNVSKNFTFQAESASIVQQKLVDIQQEKSSIEEKLSEVSETLASKSREMELFKESAADEKRELAIAFESELRSMTQKSASLEEEISSLVELKNALETNTAMSANEKNDLKHKNLLLKTQTEESLTQLEQLKKVAAETQEAVDSKDMQLRQLQTEMAANSSQVKDLQGQLEQLQVVLDQRTSSLQDQVKITHDSEKLVEVLQTEIQSQKEKMTMLDAKKKEIESNSKAHLNELDKLRRSMIQVEQTCALLKETNKAQEDEIVSIKRKLEQNESTSTEMLAFQKKCVQLEIELKEVSEKARQQQSDHEKHIIRLNEELGKAKIHMSPSKKLSSFAEMDFNHGNNTLSSIDIFDDQTEYANFFRQPVPGRSPVGSPTRVLTESNARTTVDVQSKIAPREMGEQSDETQHLVQADENRPEGNL